AVSYGEAVHRQDATGTWQEIDNTLTLQNGKYRTPDGRVQLAATNGSDNLLQLTENGYSIGLSFATGGADNTAPYALQSVNTTAATVQNATREAVLEGDSPAVQYEKLSRVLNRSSLQYANLLANTDVRYTLHGNDVTGRITLRGQRESYNVALRLQLVGLTPSLDEAGNVILSDATTGTAVHTIPAPGVSAPGLVAAYQLLPVSDGLYLLGVTTTPVLDDNISTEDFGSLTPGGENTAVTLSVEFEYVTDTEVYYPSYTTARIASNDPYGDYSGWDMIYFADDSIGYLWLSLPELPENVVPENIELSLWYSQYQYDDEEGTDNGMDYTIRLYAATYPWREQSNWNYISASEQENYGMSTTLVDSAVGENSATYIDFDVSYLVGSWYSNAPNYGFGIVCPNDGAAFYLCGSPYPPILSVSYSYVGLPDGVYFIQNQQFSTFLETSGGNVSVQDFEVTDAQKWKITYITDGYYEISTLDGANILTASDSTAGVTMENRGSSLSTNQQWFISAGGGGYSFSPRSARYEVSGVDRFNVCLGVSGTSGAQTVGMLTSSNNLTAERLWNIYGLVNVNVYYDHAYVMRYGNITNSADPAANAIIRTRLSNYMENLKAEYFTEFGIVIDYSTPQRVACYACNEDPEQGPVCATWQTYHDYLKGCEGSLCSYDCVNQGETHHTNLYNIWDNFVRKYYVPTPNKKDLNVFFVGHDHCVEDEYIGHLKTPALAGLSHKDYRVLVVSRHYETSAYWGELATPEREFQTLLHEFGHFFCAPDHYDTIENGYDDLNYLTSEAERIFQRDFDDFCIYGSDGDSDAACEQLPICSGCSSIIQENGTRYSRCS
ncbi:MAG: RICIN domain-containing protein, partial [Clostridia bacterium]|nr:RICIN domain-containing protein [Clostridia bacterium]